MPIKTIAVLLAAATLGLGAWVLRPEPAPASSLEHPIRRPMITRPARDAARSPEPERPHPR